MIWGGHTTSDVLSALYGSAMRLRRAWYAQHPHSVRRLGRPVVSVGNLVVGGSGKTPLVAAVARFLIAAGERPSVLSRGYGRREPSDGVVVVSDGRAVIATAEQSGDEPQMLARSLPGVPVLASPDRFLAGRLAERHFDSTVHLLDDGFQHVQLARDIDVLVMAAADLDDRLIPFGRLREPLTAARHADAVIVSGTEADMRTVASYVGVERVFDLVSRYGAPRGIPPFGSPGADAVGGKVVAVAGIARPSRFFAALRAFGWNVVRELKYRDHHWFTARDVAVIQRAALEGDAGLVITTEKDAMRLRLERLDAAGVPWAFLPMTAHVEPEDEFMSWLMSRLAAARRVTGAAA